MEFQIQIVFVWRHDHFLSEQGLYVLKTNENIFYFPDHLENQFYHFFFHCGKLETLCVCCF